MLSPTLQPHGAPPAHWRDNFLFAIYPPPDVAARMHLLVAEHRALFGFGAPARPQRILHATLCVLAGEQSVQPASLVADAVCEKSFDVSFDCALSFGSSSDDRHKLPHVLACSAESNPQLHRLRNVLGEPLRQMGLLRRKHFVPHVTLLYDTVAAPKRMIEPIRWRVDRFALVHSHYGETRHQVLHEWRLDA